MFTHVVLFWLKPDAPASLADQMIHSAKTSLSQIPGVLSIDAGKPAMTPRPVVDNSYHVGLLVLLQNSASHDTYQSHPLHQAFGQQFRPHWERILVYDFQ